MDRLHARYELETPLSLEHTAEVIAGEQSSGTFVSLPGESEALRARSRAVVEQVVEVSASTSPALPCRMTGDNWSRGEVHISWPIDTVGISLTNVLATVAGNLFELAEVSALRLLDVTFPDEFAQRYPGPQFGVEGTLKLCDNSDGPLIGTIIKPSVGLSANQTAELVKQLADAGIDFIKDDELQANGPQCSFEDRLAAVMSVINRHADATGKKVMYAFNITDEIDVMKRNADRVRDAGGTCIMASMHSIGLAGLSAIREHAELPIHCHRNGWGLFSRSPDIGISYRAWQKFWRIAGADHLHVNGLSNKFSESDESVLDSALAVGEPLFGSGHANYAAMPVFSSGQTARQMAETISATSSTKFLLCAGGGIIGHPQGIAAGVASLRQAATAASAGVDLKTFAQDHPELASALEKFGA